MTPFGFVEESAPRRLFAALPPERLAHGYLFTGPVGVGKRAFALALAKSLLCAGRKDGLLGYDDVCASCRLVDVRTHPDLFVHDGELKIGERDGRDDGLTARELVRALSLRGYGSARRVVVLGEVGFATHHAANALLKFFEKPPANVHLLLTTSAPGRLLDTIRSRLIEVVFPPLSDATLERVLVDQGCDPVAAARVAPAASGSVTRARSLLEGAGLREEVAAWFFAALEGQAREAAWATRAQLDEALRLVALIVRDWLVAGVDATRRGLSGESLRLRPYLAARPAALAVSAALQEARRVARSNVTPALVVDGLRLALAEAGAQATARR